MFEIKWRGKNDSVKFVNVIFLQSISPLYENKLKAESAQSREFHDVDEE